MYSQSAAVRDATEDLIHLSMMNNAGHAATAGRSHATQRVSHNNRYYGAFLSSRELHGPGLRYVDDDAESTWHYRAPRHAITRSRPTSRDSNTATPAQVYAAEYRQDQDTSHPSGASNSSRVDRAYSQSTDEDSTGMTADTSLADSEPKARYRQSRATAHERYLREAWLMFIAGRFEGDAQIQCHRPGCNAALPSLVDLARHLYFHDIMPSERPSLDRYDEGHAVHPRWPLEPVFETGHVPSRELTFKGRLLRLLGRLACVGCCHTSHIEA